MDNLQNFRKEIIKHGYDGFIIPMSDEFCYSFIGQHAKCIEWLSGFSGSSGLIIVMHDRCALFTDSRYTIQANLELDSRFEIFDICDKTPCGWIEENYSDPLIALDPQCSTIASFEEYSKIRTVTTANPCTYLWNNRPRINATKIHKFDYSGSSSLSRCKDAAQLLPNLSSCIISSPAITCWLLNMRAEDVDFTPLILCNCVLHSDGSVWLFVDKDRINFALESHISIYNPDQFQTKIKTLSHACVSNTSTPFAILQLLRENNIEISYRDNALERLRSIKTIREIKGMEQAHILDGVALAKFMYTLHNTEDLVTELSAADLLYNFRKESRDFKGNSFPTISAFKQHAAIVHYTPTKQSDVPLTGNGLYLLDSGGQYSFGTTDVTRTIPIGNVPYEQCKHYTIVLKAHIKLARISFPLGTNGSQLDGIARYHLWMSQCNYGHATGHGVGSYLSVHEGPYSISPNSILPIAPNIVLSNEPGLYISNAYGIRIENLIYTDYIDDKQEFLAFQMLTCIPIDTRIILQDMLDHEEKDWITEYNKSAISKVSEYLTQDIVRWMEQHYSCSQA